MTKQKRARSKTRLASTDEERPLDISATDDDPTTTEERFDRIIEQARAESTSTDPKSARRRRKKGEETLLEKLKKGEGLKKGEDRTLLANTYDPDDVKGEKSNKWRQKENNQINKGSEDKNGHINLAYEDETESPRVKKKKKVKKPAVIERDEVIEKAPTPVKKKLKKKLNKPPEEDGTLSPGTMDEEETQPTHKTVKKKPRKKKPQEDRTMSASEDPDRSADDLEETRTQSEDNVLSDGTEEGTKVKKRKKKKKAVKGEAKEASQEAGTEAAEEREEEPEVPRVIEDEGRVIGTIIHRTDKLKTDFYISHPLVRVQIIDLATGAPLKKQTRDRAVTSFYERDNDNVDYILPIMTFPFDFKQNKSVLPVWEETLVFNENFNYIINSEPSVMMFFELLDFVSMNTARVKYSRDRSDGGWHRIAWAFLKVVGAGGKPNTDKKVRLQLYRPPIRFNPKQGTPEVYQWWKSGQRVSYPSTLYVTVKGIILPALIQPAARSLFATQPEQGKISYDEIQKTLDLGAEKRADRGRHHKPSPWSRLPGQMCKVPNMLAYTLPVSRQGCFTIRFSPDGRSLACACHDKDSYPIVLYNIPEGTVKGQMLGHYRIIYDLCWSRDSKLLLSASSDCTARVWDGQQVSQTPLKLLPHPTYVYSARFHVYVHKVVVTGSYDRIIRVWSLHGNDIHGELMQELDGHMGHVNTLCFDEGGSRLYSGDSFGKIKVWNAYTTEQASKKGIRQDWTANSEIAEAEMDGVAINYIHLHPNGRRLLAHCRDNVIRMVDLRINVVMQRYHGALNFREQIRSTITPCGSFVFSGSEDCTAYVWNAEAGDRVASYKELGYKSSVVDVDYHPHDHLVAFCSYGENHPVLLYKYDHAVAQRDAGLETPVRLISPRRTGRPASPEMFPGATRATDDESAELSTRVPAIVQDDFETGTMARLERVQRKLDAVTGFFTSTRALSPDHPHAVPYSGTLPPTMGTTMMNTTYGSSFNASAWYSQIPSDTEPLAFFWSGEKRESNLPPSMFSPHAGKNTLNATYQQQQQLATETQYQRQAGQFGHRPGFSALGTHGSLQRPGSPNYGRVPTISFNNLQGKPQFSFQSGPGAGASSKEQPGHPAHGQLISPYNAYSTVPMNQGSAESLHSGRQTEVVALYEYNAQRSDELSLARGDVITVLYKDNENWWMGELVNGQQGFFPANYVTGESDNKAKADSSDDILDEYQDLSKGKDVEDDDTKKLKERMAAVISKSGELKIFSATESETDTQTPKKYKKKKKSVPGEGTSVLLEDETATPSKKKPSRRKKKKSTTHESEA